MADSEFSSGPLPGATGTPCLRGEVPGHQLRPDYPHRLGGRPDEGDPRGLAGIGKLGTLREEPVAGMDGIRPAFLGRSDDRLQA